MDFYHFKPACKVIKRGKIVKNPILTNYDEKTISEIFISEEELIQEGSLNPEYFGILHNFSRKVFIGGLPRNITEESVTGIFSKFGSLDVDWPYKENSANAFVPPKGFVFLLFEENESVDRLLKTCQRKGDGYFIFIPTEQNKKLRVQVRPWKLTGVNHFFVPVSQINLRLAIFVGGVPRTLNAKQIGLIMEQLFGHVAYVGIDIDSVYSYPKGSARVIFVSKNSLISALKKRFIMPAESGKVTTKMMEIKPFVLDDQICDRCQNQNYAGTPSATFLCPEPECLLYLCEYCWAQVHSSKNSAVRIHKPIVKQGRDDYAYSLKKRGFYNATYDQTYKSDPALEYGRATRCDFNATCDRTHKFDPTLEYDRTIRRERATEDRLLTSQYDPASVLKPLRSLYL